MIFSEIILMALTSLGVNKLRSGLTMLGITIGVFSVIGVMTCVSALRGSVESGLSALGSDTFQFVKRANSFGPPDSQQGRRLANRRDITYGQAKRYQELKLLERAGEIGNLETHRRFELIVNGIKVGV